MFITGQQVVCIDDKFPLGIEKLYVALPKEGETYLVRGMAPGVALDCKSAELAVYLVGLHNPSSGVPPHREFGFRCERFRPLEELTEDEIAKVGKPELVPA